jgi:hypothetical protein
LLFQEPFHGPSAVAAGRGIAATAWSKPREYLPPTHEESAKARAAEMRDEVRASMAAG